MLQRIPVNTSEQKKDASQVNKDFVKNYNEESDEGYFFEVDGQYIKKLYEIQNFYWKE